MSENTTPEVELSDQDIADLKELGLDPEVTEHITQRSLLTLWKEIFSNAPTVREQKIPMAVAAKVCASWPKLSMQDTAVYHDLYHAYIEALGEHLKEVPAEAFEFVGADDGVENREVYTDLLVGWHVHLDFIKDSWDAADPESHIQAAALVDAGAFVFGETGLSGHLAAIGFQLDEEAFMARVAARKSVEEA